MIRLNSNPKIVKIDMSFSWKRNIIEDGIAKKDEYLIELEHTLFNFLRSITRDAY